MRTMFAFMALILAFLVSCQNSELKKMEEGFKNPGVEYRPLALWAWLNGYVDTTQLVYELEQMKEKGMRGALIWDVGSLSDPEKVIPAGPAMLGDTSLQYFSIALQKAKELGLDLGWFASSSWNAGGPWVEEENAAVELISSTQSISGPGVKSIARKLPEQGHGQLKRYQIIKSVAYQMVGDQLISYEQQPVTLDLPENGDAIQWDVPEGNWVVMSFFMNNSFQHLECPSPNSDGLIIDHLSKIATKNHFDSILTRLSTVNTPENHLKFFMLDSYEVWPMTDWSPMFVDEFVRQYGYDPLPYLPLLTGFSSEDSVFDARFRGDYHRLVSDMIIENHFSQSVDIANANDFQMVTEAGHGGYARVDPLKALGHSHIPMGEFWNRQRFWVTKEAASAAHIYGIKTVAAESLTGWNHWQQGPSDFKQLIDIAFCQGLNQVVFHTFDHQPGIAGKPGFGYHAGEHINVNTSWWEMARQFMDYLSRCSYLLREGNVVADACLYYGDQAPNWVPPDRIDPNIEPIYGDDQCLHCGQPKPVNPGSVPGYDYDYINAEVIIRDLEYRDGYLVLPHGQRYRVMLLPDEEAISLEVLEKIEALVEAGATIVGPKPLRATSLRNYPECDEQVKAIADRLWNGEKKQGQVIADKSLLQVLQGMDIHPDFGIEGIDNSDLHIDYIHRQTEDAEIYFISNSMERGESFSVTFRVDPSFHPQIWDPMTGQIQRKTDYEVVDGGIRMKLEMDPLSSRFVVFSGLRSQKNDPDLVQNLQFAENTSRLSGERQILDLSNDWLLSMDPKMGGPEAYELAELLDWTDLPDHRIKYYSGKATYSKTVELTAEDVASEEIWLEFENIQEMARVFVNDQEAGYCWTPPYRISLGALLKTGTNEIRVEVINTWNNRLVGDAVYPDQKQYTRSNLKSRFGANKPLLPSGIMGKAELSMVN